MNSSTDRSGLRKTKKPELSNPEAVLAVTAID